ncbi:CheR family methyltransferase [Thermodesulforhabdus norvegica]|uniref:protein-glutamate O-methyltransferase n=1 Tax=Thermodesulforhabdus norvegica TaxID=39841 RepID=A0A1I4RDQ3_9BACT|nr:protein-glutamate O-methyltransferase [Thermodesulforhabdus norvegica]SFM50337.1 chemotaxis protein methyltransferase CheR [Thermodesulforhabdus norvegica]
MIQETLKDDLFRKFSALVYETAGIHLHEGKKALLQARLSKRLRATGIKTFKEYYDFITKPENVAEFIHFLDAISTNLTYFFREEQHFRFLESRALPEIVEVKKKEGSRRVRMWSAGCSTGEEPYSIAMCVLEFFEKKTPEIRWDFKLLATDISTRVLQTAIRGLYSKEKVERVPAPLRTKYFKKVQGSNAGEYVYEVAPILKEVTVFRRLNLKDPYPFHGPFEVIFCRNVMIYFDKPTQQELIQRMTSYLSPGGYFMVGHSESLAGLSHGLKYIQPAVYKKLS